MSSISTEQMINSFPMFGDTGWTALEYAKAYDQLRCTTSTTSGSLERTLTDSTQDNITPPTTAGTQRDGYGMSLSMFCKRNSSLRRRAKGTFLNHTPRDHETWTPPMDSEWPLETPKENYSRPRTSDRSTSVDHDRAFTNGHGYSASIQQCKAEFYQVSVLPVTSIELESTRTSSSSSEEQYPSLDKPLQRSTSVPITRAPKSEPRTMLSMGYERNGCSIWSTKSHIKHFRSLKIQCHEQPSKNTSLHPKNARYAPLEPLVAEHRRKGSHETLRKVLVQAETEETADTGIFGSMEDFLDGQAGEAISTPETTFHAYLPESQDTHLLGSSVSTHSELAKKRMTRWPVFGLEMQEQRPAVPERSSQRPAHARFPLHAKSCSSMNASYAAKAQEQYKSHRRSRTLDYDVQGSSKQPQKSFDLGKTTRAGSSQIGRLAPPILSHAALTASADLGLNDLSFYLKHTGPPSPESHLVQGHRRKKSLKLFRSKDRKKQAAPDVQSASASLQRIQKQASVVPSCAREMKTTGGARHLRIVVPATENEYEMQDGPVAPRQYDTEQVGKREGVLRKKDYHCERAKPTYSDALFGNPVHASDAVQDTTTDGHCGNLDERVEDEDPACTMERLKERLVLLQRQNTRLMEELVRILGLEMVPDELEVEDVLRASARARFATYGE